MQITSTAVGPSLPSLATLLFNRPARGVLPKFIRTPMIFDNDESNHAALIKRQSHVYTGTDTCEHILFLPTGSTVALQCKNGEHWMHGIVVAHRSDYHHSRSYRIQVSKAGYIITRTSRHVKTTPVKTEEYLRNEVRKYINQGAKSFDELTVNYMKLYENEKAKQN